MASRATKGAAGATAGLARPVVPPLLPPDFAGSPEADREVLRAAGGDKAALEERRKYLFNRRYARRWGDPVYAVRC